jgi:23S rRNA (cytidine1920-2'-O)/16S rRNA (cytidine1409-2'-O)-methyltransferase
VVRDPQVHQEVLRQVWRAAQGAGLVPLDAMASPLLGPEGNAEFLLWLWRPGPGGDAPAFVARPIEEAVARAVEEAHRLMHRG